METAELVDRLDEELSTADYADVDASANGLQVGRRSGHVDRVAFAVDGAEMTVREAAEWNADLFVVHHGLSWGGIDYVTGRTYDRIAALVDHGIDLYVSHLPLDGHREFGNAAGIADLLDLRNRRPFGEIGSCTIGQQGTLETALDSAEIELLLANKLDHGGRGIQVLDFGPDTIEDVAIVTGGGADWFDEAVEAGVDAFVTGEGKGKLYHQAREAGVTVFLGGHYATETFGVRSLADLVDRWGPETTFIEAPTRL